MFLVDGVESEPVEVESVEVLSARARVVATQVSVLQAELAAIALALDGVVPDGMTTVEWLCLQTGLMPIEARRLLRVARKLAKLPGLAAAFEAGALSEGTVDVLVRVATPANEGALLEAARVATGAQLHTIIRSYQRQKPTPTGEDEPGDPDPGDRPDEYSGGFDDDGRYRFRGNVGPDLGSRLDSSLRGEIDADRRRRTETHRQDDTEPRPSEDPPLTLAGALSNLVDGYLSALAARRANGVVPSTHTAIVHLNKHNIDTGWIDDAAWLHTGGALTPHQAMLAACDAAWRAVISSDLDPQGVTRQHRLAGPAQRAACYVRDRSCVFPGCGRTHWLKIHHLQPEATAAPQPSTTSPASAKRITPSSTNPAGPSPAPPTPAWSSPDPTAPSSNPPPDPTPPTSPHPHPPTPAHATHPPANHSPPGPTTCSSPTGSPKSPSPTHKPPEQRRDRSASVIDLLARHGCGELGGEDAGQTAGVEEHDRLVRRDATRSGISDERCKGFAAVHRIQHQCLEPRCESDRLEAGIGHLRIPRTDLALVELEVVGRHGTVGQCRDRGHETADAILDVVERPDVHAADPCVRSKAHDEAGLRPTGTGGRVEQRPGGRLRHQLVRGIDVAVRADRRRAPERDLVRGTALLRQAQAGLGQHRLERLALHLARPDELGTEQQVEHEVALDRAGRAAEHHHAVHPRLAGGRRGHPHVVRLDRTRRDEGPASLCQGVAHQELQLAGLVPTAGEPRQVVALHEQRARRQAQLSTEPIHRLERRRQDAEREAVHGCTVANRPISVAAVRIIDLPTPALVVDRAAFDHNVATMAGRWPGTALRPHVKAFKSTALAAELAANGHTGFCCATVREVVGMAEAGLGTDLLLANEVPDRARLAPLGELVTSGAGRITIAVDSPDTIDAAAGAGLREVLVDVNVGMPRCGCAPDDAAALADRARSAGLTVRGTMGYEGHVVGVTDRAEREAGAQTAGSILATAHAAVGGPICSGGGTGTWDCNPVITELQAGSYVLLDTAYDELDTPFRRGLAVVGTVLSRNPADGYAVADVGLKALGMDHGPPRIDDASVWFCSDEHVTFSMRHDRPLPPIGGRILVWPAHLDPTVALHERMHVVDTLDPFDATAEVRSIWPVDLRNW